MATSLRVSAACLFALLAGFQVVRTAIIEDSYGTSPAVANSRDPEVLSTHIMREVGEAAAKGAEPSEQTLAALERLADAAPLAPVPFLVKGAVELHRGRTAAAEPLLLEARRRGPRAPAARYLLADLYLRSQRPVPAMGEMAVLNRLPYAGSTSQLAVSLAAYAKVPGALPQLRTILGSYPELEQSVLAVLAQDAANVDLVLSLAEHERTQGPTPEWEVNLLTALAQSGAYGRALDLWQRLSGAAPAKDSVFNPRFTDSSAPAPFNWTLASGAGGVAEAKAGGLKVLFFGRDNVELARQTLLLSPGRYELSMRAAGTLGSAGSVRWSIYCLKDNAELLRLPIKSGQIGGRFQVRPGCPVQTILLAGDVQDVAQQADFVVDQLALRKVGA